MAGKPPGSTARSSVSSRGSPSEENGPAVPPTASYSRGSSISGAPPPIPERSTPGPGSIGRHGSLSSVSSDLPEQPTERAPTLSSVGRRDSAGKFTELIFFQEYLSYFYYVTCLPRKTKLLNRMKVFKKVFCSIIKFFIWLKFFLGFPK